MQETPVQKFCLVGHPLGNSLSPHIHALFAQEYALNIEYTLQPIPNNQLANFVQHFFSHSGVGMNITTPYKQEICQHVDVLDHSARFGAVNTIYKSSAKLIGANTDAIGFERSLLYHQLNLDGQRILILGSGGVVRGILNTIMQHKVDVVYIANRTPESAEELLTTFTAPNIICKSLTEIGSINVDVVIHAISSNTLDVTLYNQINCKGTWYDLNYYKTPNFLYAGSAIGAARLINGLSMLIEQAAHAFELWHKVTPNTTLAYKTFLSQKTA